MRDTENGHNIQVLPPGTPSRAGNGPIPGGTVQGETYFRPSKGDELVDQYLSHESLGARRSKLQSAIGTLRTFRFDPNYQCGGPCEPLGEIWNEFEAKERDITQRLPVDDDGIYRRERKGKVY